MKFTKFFFVFYVWLFAAAGNLHGEEGKWFAPVLEEAKGEVSIVFENGISLKIHGESYTLTDAAKKKFEIDFSKSQKIEESPSSPAVVEKDLGGSLKKRPPLAHKNPKVQPIHHTGRPFIPAKNQGLKTTRVTEEKTESGDLKTTSFYADGSRSELTVNPFLRMERAFNRKGEVVWSYQEGEKFRLKFRVTFWEDGSKLKECSSAQGTVSITEENQGQSQTISFLNSERQTLKTIPCEKGQCSLE